MHTHTTLTKIYYESRDTCTRHIAGILCPCFKLCTAEDDRKKEKLWLYWRRKEKKKRQSTCSKGIKSEQTDYKNTHLISHHQLFLVPFFISAYTALFFLATSASTTHQPGVFSVFSLPVQLTCHPSHIYGQAAKDRRVGTSGSD